ncbi:MAG: LamG domain-containing protein, partial [Verrucomicrobiota bacterium]
QTSVSQAFTYNSSGSILAGYPFTIALWMRADPGNWNQICAFLGDPSVDTSYYELSLSTAVANAVARNTSKTAATSPAAFPVADGLWHHLAGVYTANRRTLYLDGIAVATNSATVNFVTNNKRFALGALMRSSPTDAFVGDLDDVGLWNVAVSPERLALIHALGRYSGADLADSAIDTLLSVYTAHSGFASVGGVVWVPAAGLSGLAGNSGVTNGQPFLVINSIGEGFIGLTRPQLNLTQSSEGIVTLSWHSGFADWILEESSDLAPDDWSESAEAVEDDGLTRSVSYSLPDLDSRFFRLKSP